MYIDDLLRQFYPFYKYLVGNYLQNRPFGYPTEDSEDIGGFLKYR